MRWTHKAIELRERFSTRVIINTLIILIISIIFFTISDTPVIEALFGLAMILSGAIILLFIIIYLILFFLDRLERKKQIANLQTPVKKIAQKKVSTKKVAAKKKPITKKVTKKKTSTKTTTKKKIAKKPVKKKTISKKRK